MTRLWTLNRRSVSSLLLIAALTSCTTNPATGRRQFNLIGESQEIAMGRDADKGITASLGVYDDDSLGTYVQDLGVKLAATSERPGLPWSFRVLDDPVVNAFALPGGYLYVTRGILAHLGSEAELVAVIGHEIGHVTALHGVNRLTKAQLATVGIGVGVAIRPDLAGIGDIAQTGLGLLFLKYGRDDERQADDLGLRYALRSDYDPRPMAEVFTLLKRVSQQAGAGSIPGWLSTHPNPDERRDRIEQQIADLNQNFDGARVRRNPYLRRLDGLVFGEDPRQGYFEGARFYHPEMEFRLDMPAKWKGVNRRDSVAAMSPDENAIVQLTLSGADSPASALDAFLADETIQSERRQRIKVHGLSAVAVNFTVTDPKGNLLGRIVCLRYQGRVFQLVGYGLESGWSANRRGVRASVESFRALTDRRKLDVEADRIRIVELRRDMTLKQFQQKYPSSVELPTLAVLNHVEEGDTLRRGSLIKRVVGGRGH